jgi:hypothetical protein
MSPELQLAIEAIRDRLSRSPSREFCYARLGDAYKARGLTQHHLQRLAGLGLIRRVDDSRGGHRVYYEVPDLPMWRVAQVVVT